MHGFLITIQTMVSRLEAKRLKIITLVDFHQFPGVKASIFKLLLFGRKTGEVSKIWLNLKMLS